MTPYKVIAAERPPMYRIPKICGKIFFRAFYPATSGRAAVPCSRRMAAEKCPSLFTIRFLEAAWHGIPELRGKILPPFIPPFPDAFAPMGLPNRHNSRRVPARRSACPVQRPGGAEKGWLAANRPAGGRKRIAALRRELRQGVAAILFDQKSLCHKKKRRGNANCGIAARLSPQPGGAWPVNTRSEELKIGLNAASWVFP